jgi:hypothetical protein
VPPFRRLRNWLVCLIIQVLVLVSPGAGKPAFSVVPKTYNGSIFQSDTYTTPEHCVGDDSLRYHLRVCLSAQIKGVYIPSPSPSGTSSVELVDATAIGEYSVTSHSGRKHVPWAVEAWLINNTDGDREERDHNCDSDCRASSFRWKVNVPEVQYHYPFLGICKNVQTHARLAVKVIPNKWYTAMLYAESEIEVQTQVCA